MIKTTSLNHTKAITTESSTHNNSLNLLAENSVLVQSCDPCSVSNDICLNGGLCFNLSCNPACLCHDNFKGVYCEISLTSTSTSK